MSTTSAQEFAKALATLQMPRGGLKRFLQAHYAASGRAMTATNLAQAANYKDHRGFNLHYGLLATRIGNALGSTESNLGLLVEFLHPYAATNREYVLIMRPEFAEALRQAGWVKTR